MRPTSTSAPAVRVIEVADRRGRLSGVRGQPESRASAPIRRAGASVGAAQDVQAEVGGAGGGGPWPRAGVPSGRRRAPFRGPGGNIVDGCGQSSRSYWRPPPPWQVAQVVHFPGDDVFADVAVTADGTVWTAGHRYLNGRRQGFVQSLKGKARKALPGRLPELSAVATTTSRVWAFGPNRAYAWNGRAWTSWSLGTFHAADAETVSARDVWAVGGNTLAALDRVVVETPPRPRHRPGRGRRRRAGLGRRERRLPLVGQGLAQGEVARDPAAEPRTPPPPSSTSPSSARATCGRVGGVSWEGPTPRATT